MLKNKLKNKLKNNIVFLATTIISILIIIYSLKNTNELTIISSDIMKFVSTNFGWLYVLFVFFLMIFLLVLSFSKYGKIKLGKEPPEYSNFSWYTMLFCGGTGIGLVFWSIAEPLSHYAMPPSIIDPASTESENFSIRTCFLHWGLTQWSCFAIVGLSLAFFQYNKGKRYLISNLIIHNKNKLLFKIASNIIDTFSVIVSVSGVATSLGLGVFQICGGLNYLFGISNSQNTWLILILLISFIFVISAVSGINRGIRNLSNLNSALAFLLLVTAFLIGPKIRIVETLTNGLGEHLQNIIGDSLMMSPYTNDPWIMNWRVFYYAWFIAWTPFVGMFIARISKGRSIREFIFGTVIVPTLFTIIWLSVFGTIAISAKDYWDLSSLIQIVNAPETAVFVVFENYPFSKFVSILVIALLFIFFITSADSATFSLSIMTSNGYKDPSQKKKIVWSLLISSTAYILLSIGNLKALQTISIAASLPFLFIMMIMIISLLKALKQWKKHDNIN